MKHTRKISVDSIDEFNGESVAWEMDGVDATYLGKVAVIVVVAILVL